MVDGLDAYLELIERLKRIEVLTTRLIELQTELLKRMEAPRGLGYGGEQR